MHEEQFGISHLEIMGLRVFLCGGSYEACFLLPFCLKGKLRVSTDCYSRIDANVKHGTCALLCGFASRIEEDVGVMYVNPFF